MSDQEIIQQSDMHSVALERITAVKNYNKYGIGRMPYWV